MRSDWLPPNPLHIADTSVINSVKTQMANQCRYIKDNKVQCKRKLKVGKLCFQHSRNKKFSLILFIPTIISLWWLIPNIYNRDVKPQLEKNGLIEIVCDRDKDMGCNINFTKQQEVAFKPTEGPNKGTSTYYTLIDMRYGDCKEQETVRLHDGVDLPSKNKKIFKFPKNYGPVSPYSIEVKDGKINLSGDLYEFKTGEYLGWFTGNEFGVNKPCAFSWNKDENGIEIVDKYNNVIFALHKRFDETLFYRGYYKSGRTIFIYTDKTQYRTNNTEEAEKLIKEIPKMFVHTGSNSLGKRTGKFVSTIN